MVLGSILNPINSSMIAVALVPIGIALGAPPSQTAWLVSGALPGHRRRAAGRRAARRPLRSAPRCTWSAPRWSGSPGLLGALAPNLGVLVAARVLLGFGTCAGYPAAMYLIRSESERTGDRQPERRADRARGRQPDRRGRSARPLGGLLIGARRLAHHLHRQHPAVAGLPGARATAAAAGRAADPHARGIDLAWASRCSPGRSSALMLFLMEPAARPLVLAACSPSLAGAGFARRELRRPTRSSTCGCSAATSRCSRPTCGSCSTYDRLVRLPLRLHAVARGGPRAVRVGRRARSCCRCSTGAIVVDHRDRAGGPRSAASSWSARSPSCVVCGLLLAVDATHARSGSSSRSPCVAGVPQGLNSLANQNALYHQADPARIGRARACCAPSSTSARSSPRPPPRPSSTHGATPPACTTWPSSCSSSPRAAPRAHPARPLPAPHRRAHHPRGPP